MNSSNELLLILGDALIPSRQPAIPELFKKMFIPGRFDHVLITGNMGSQINIEFFKSICNSVSVIRGVSEDESIYPYSCELEIGNCLIGLVSGCNLMVNSTDGLLSRIANQKKYDIVVYGNTHELSVTKKENTLFLNPGSLTGAFHPSHPYNRPSFLLLEISQNDIIVYSYQINENKLDVNKSIFSSES